MLRCRGVRGKEQVVGVAGWLVTGGASIVKLRAGAAALPGRATPAEHRFGANPKDMAWGRMDPWLAPGSGWWG